MSLLPVQGGLLQKHTSADKHSGAKDVSGLRGEVRKKSHFPGRLHCEPLGLHPPGPLETLNHAWECLTQGRGELGYRPSISHRACHWPRGTPQYISLCPCETGLGPGTAAVWLALGCSSPQATKFRETARDSAQAQLGQILDQKTSKKEEKNTLLSFLKSQRQKKKRKKIWVLGAKIGYCLCHLHSPPQRSGQTTPDTHPANAWTHPHPIEV